MTTTRQRPRVSSTSRSRAAPLNRPLSGSQDSREAIVLALVVAGALAVLGVWLGDTPAHALRTLGDRLTAAGRVTGLVGTYLVLVQVVLMSRLPWLDRFIGADRLSAWHRWNGAYAISLLVAHALLIIWGYALTDRVSGATESGRLIRSYPDMLAATVGLLLLVAVGVLSARQARRRLRYETWYFIHLYMYIAIALSFSHQLATGNDFTTHPFNRVLWVGLYLVTGVLLVWFRVAVPVRDALRHRLRVHSVVPEGATAVSVYITGRDLDGMGAEAGQFLRWRFLTRDGWYQAHPFSLSAAPNSRFLRITAKSVGDHSSELRRLRRGTRVMAEGPYGSFTARRRTRPKVLLVAGGVGITPLRALLEELPAGHGDVTLIYRASSEDDLLLRSEIEELARTKGARVRYVVGPRHRLREAFGPRHLRKVVPDVRDRDVFLCGPPGLMRSARKSLRALGVPRAQIHSERFEL